MDQKAKRKIFGSGRGEAKKQFRTDAATRNQIQRESAAGITTAHIENWQFFKGMGKPLVLLTPEERTEREKNDQERLKNGAITKIIDNGFSKKYHYK